MAEIDIIIYGVGLYVIIGFLFLLIESAREGKFFHSMIYNFKAGTLTFVAAMIAGCVGAWPLILLYEILTRDQK